MDSPSIASRPDVTVATTAPRVTPTPARGAFKQVLAQSLVRGAETAMKVLPGSPLMAVAVRGGSGAGSALGVPMTGIGSSPVRSGGISPEGPGGGSSRVNNPAQSAINAALSSPTGSGSAPGTSGVPGAEGGSLESSLQQSQDMNLYYLQIQEAVNSQNRSFTALSNGSGLAQPSSTAVGARLLSLAIWPEVAFAYYNRGLVSLQLGDADAALEDLNKAAEITPDNPELYWQRARAYQMKDRPADGLRDLEEAVRLGVAEAKILFLRSELHAQAGDTISAKMDLDAALGHEPTDATDWVIRARARFATDLVSALADLDQALKLEPKSVHALLNKVYVLKRLEKFEECMTTLNQLIELAPENALALAGRGMLYARFQNWDAAKADGKEALIQDAGYQVVYQVAAIYSRLSEHEPVYRARALDLLTVAVKTGVDRTFLLKDPEFRAISDAPEFKRLAKGE